MSKKSCAKFNKGKNPNNLSGSLKKATDMILSLSKITGNPKMREAVGAGNLAHAAAEVAKAFGNEPQNNDDDKRRRIAELKAEIARLKALLADLKALLNDEDLAAVEEVKQSIKDLEATIKKLEQELAELEGKALAGNG